VLAVQLSQKHEAAPTALKPTKEFRETVKVGSMNSWDKVTLTAFHVGFNHETPSELRGFIDPRYFDHPTKDEDFHDGN
jgi:hypothetical protein